MNYNQQEWQSINVLHCRSDSIYFFTYVTFEELRNKD